MAITGVGLADNQIPPYLNDIPAIQDIDRNGSLLVHGAFAGMTSASNGGRRRPRSMAAAGK